MNQLFDALKIGDHTAKNRVFMAPMTRGRATAEGIPLPHMATYYAQRATGGLLITEATAVSAQGVGWVNAPRIDSEEAIAAWRPVTDAVHEEGGLIFLQLWHLGRVSHPDFLGGELPVGPSAITAAGESHTPLGKKPYVEPRALDASELPGIVADYANGAKNAIAAGFDGVEIHGANGYLIDQFLKDGSNQRDDDFGGSIANRWRFPLQVVDAVAAAIGAERTGLRLSPTGSYNGMSDTDPVALYAHGAPELDKRNLAFVHVVEHVPGHMFATPGAPAVAPTIRASLRAPLILNGGFDRETGNAAIAEDRADAIAFGTPFLANPDLVARLSAGSALNQPDFMTLYTPGEKGYTDYPTLG
ncbi:MAG: alkene reductase [Myxococcales bacterium]|nr:alkene reductase [Myxococcales bacterium]